MSGAPGTDSRRILDVFGGTKSGLGIAKVVILHHTSIKNCFEDRLRSGASRCESACFARYIMQSMSKNGHPYRSRKAKVAKTDDVLRGQIESPR